MKKVQLFKCYCGILHILNGFYSLCLFYPLFPFQLFKRRNVSVKLEDEDEDILQEPLVTSSPFDVSPVLFFCIIVSTVMLIFRVASHKTWWRHFLRTMFNSSYQLPENSENFFLEVSY
mgnify:CR=1 FL=1